MSIARCAFSFLRPSEWHERRRRSRNGERERRPKVLLAWEIGAGFTHSQNALGVVAHLAENGVECVFATADPRFDPWFRAYGTPVTQTYLWPPMRVGSASPELRDARTLTDILANYGVADPAHLAACIAHYDTLFELVQPDVLLCENAFGALLAGRGRMPTIVFGSTLLFMPPRSGDGFAPIAANSPDPSWPVQDIVDAVNSALAAFARPPLSRAADIMDCAAVLPFGPAAFDPYAYLRREPILAPYCPDLPARIDLESRKETIVYLHEGAQLIDDLMKAVGSLPPPVRLYIPALNDARRAEFERAGLQVETRMMPLERIAANARCLVHHGGVTLSAVALALGIPQIILARFYENGLAGQFVAERKLGTWLRIDAVEKDWLVAAVRDWGADDHVAARAAACSPEFRRWFDGDPTFAVAKKTAELLGIENLRPAPVRDREASSPV